MGSNILHNVVSHLFTWNFTLSTPRIPSTAAVNIGTATMRRVGIHHPPTLSAPRHQIRGHSLHATTKVSPTWFVWTMVLAC